MIRNDPEEWIQLWVLEQGRVGHHGVIVYQGVNHPYNDEPINGRHRLGTITINGTIESMDDWLLLDTEGDGTCMIHSFLLELSPTYRGLQPRQRSQAGRAYRLYVHQQLSRTRHGCSDQSLEDLRNPRIFLQDDLLSVLGNYYNIGVIYMSCSKYGAELSLAREARGRPYVMIANIGGAHYEALVRRRGIFIEQPPEADGVAAAVEAIQPLLFARRMEREAQDPTSEEAKRLRQMARAAGVVCVGAAGIGATGVGATGVGATGIGETTSTLVHTALKTWECQACTYMNPSSTHLCQTCGSSMPLFPPVSSLPSLPFLPSHPSLPSPRSQKLIDDLSNTWNCPRCTSSNASSSTNCQICEYDMLSASAINAASPSLPSPRTQKLIDDLSKTWNCPRCTIVNPISMVHCQSCGYDRTGSSAYPSSFSAGPYNSSAGPYSSSPSSAASIGSHSSKKDSHPTNLCRCIAPSTGKPCLKPKTHGQRFCSLHMKKCENPMEGRKYKRSKRRSTHRKSKRRSTQ